MADVPVAVSAVSVGVGLVGGEARDALLGQSFLSRFDVVLSRDQMVLRKRLGRRTPAGEVRGLPPVVLCLCAAPGAVANSGAP